MSLYLARAGLDGQSEVCSWSWWGTSLHSWYAHACMYHVALLPAQFDHAHDLIGMWSGFTLSPPSGGAGGVPAEVPEAALPPPITEADP